MPHSIKSLFSSRLLRLVILILCFSVQTLKAQNSQREVVSLNGEWQFFDSETNTTTSVQVPHCWQSEGMAAYRLPETKTCTYEKTIDIAHYQGRRLYLKFEGVNKTAVVSIDGKEVGRHEGGYSTFYVEITDEILEKTEVKVSVDVTNVNPSTMPVRSDFTQYAGIYRNVSLVAVNPNVSFSHADDGSNGVYLNYHVSNRDVTLAPSIVVDGKMVGIANVETTIRNADKEEIGTFVQEVNLDGTLGQKITLRDITLNDVRLWNGMKDPYLYTAEVRLTYNGEDVDCVSQKIGFRSCKVENGWFYLNGEQYQVHGVGMHQDYGAQTNVTTAEQREADINTIIEMGANAIRLSHYPHNQQVYDMCDEKGLVVWCEMPFSTVMLETEEFKNHSIQSVKEMVKQGLHHPSIIVWGIANEVSAYSFESEYPEIANKEQINAHLATLASIVKEIDPVRFVGIAQFDGANRVVELAEGIDAETKLNVIGFNPYKGWYSALDGATEENRKKHITKKLQSSLSSYRKILDAASGNTLSYVVTEYGAGGNINQHDDLGADFAWAAKNGTKGYQTVGDYHPEEYQSYVHEGNYMALYGDSVNKITAAPGIWATFAWCMFDFSCYRDEGGLERTNTKGLVTADRQTKKDAFYLYKANWNKTDYFAHICSSRYKERNSGTIDVKVYSNCDSVELIVNGKNLGPGKMVQSGVYTWSKVNLRHHNSVKAVGRMNGNEYTDMVDSWVAPVGDADIDGNGKVDICDVTLLICYLSVSQDYKNCYDVNNDGRLSVEDVYAISQKILSEDELQ